MKKVFVLSLAFMAVVPLKSQDYIKFGKVDPAYLTMENCPFDSSANAFFLFNEQTCITSYYKTSANYGTDGRLADGPEYNNRIHIHRAIKILDNNATDWGNFSFAFYSKSDKIESFKGYTYNMEDNKVVKTKLERNQVIYEDISPTRQRIKISMPQVKKGSVVELELNITSENFYSLGPWPLQFTIPVEKNILVVKMFDYYHYNRIAKGYFGIDPKYSSSTITVPVSVVEQNFNSRDRSESKITYVERVEEYNLDNVPAFPIESYLTTPDNYLASLRFELAYTKFPNSTEKHYNSSWESLTDVLLNDVKFGQQLKNTGFLTDLARELQANSPDQQALVKACFETIRDRVACNNKVGVFCEKNIRDVFKNGEGDVQSINLLLTALLREAGIRAWPVILSTRGNGLIQPIYPSIDDFNYVICMAEVNGKKLTMDASDKYLTINLLDPICLNDKGRIIDKTETGWIELTNPENSYKHTSQWDVEFSEDGVALAKVTETFEDIAAYRQRDRIRDHGSFEKYIENINHPDNGLTIKASEIENQEDLTSPLIQKLEMELEKGYMQGDLYIFLPLFTEALSENPFKLKKREYPVEFNYPINEKVRIRTRIPDGYKIESLPPNKTYTLQGGGAIYGFKVTAGDNDIVAEFDFRMSRMLFPANEYENLKEFYRIVAESQNESVVLKRSAE
jgi:transglutaminase-like putative cysteine protease